MNRNFRKFIIVGTALIAAIFIVPYIFPVNPEWYFSNLNWMIPLVIVVLVAPVVPFILNNSDIHFFFQKASDGNVDVTVVNYGTTPFVFNRVQFSSGKKYGILGKREFYPQPGLFSGSVSFYTVDIPTSPLHQYRGCILGKGLPMKLVVGGHKCPEYLRNFKVNSRIYLSLYYEETKQRVYSQRIPLDIVKNIIEDSKLD